MLNLTTETFTPEVTYTLLDLVIAFALGFGLGVAIMAIGLIYIAMEDK